MTERPARPPRNRCLDEDADRDTQQGKFLLFHLAGQDYGIEICHVTEIIGFQKINAVPGMADFFRGVINLRDPVIPVMDVRARFRMANREDNERTCIVVVDIEGQALGLVVDEVSEVINIPGARIDPPPGIDSGGGSPLYPGAGEEPEGGQDSSRCSYPALPRGSGTIPGVRLENRL